MSFCTSLRNFIQIGPPWAEKNDVMDFSGPIVGSLKSPCTTFYRSSLETIALNCLVFEEIASFCILVIDRQTSRQTNRWTASMHEAALCGLIIRIVITLAMSEYMTESEARAVARWDVGSSFEDGLLD